jgi:hypothetical protein
VLMKRVPPLIPSRLRFAARDELPHEGGMVASGLSAFLLNAL